jgi:hypothetical protein
MNVENYLRSKPSFACLSQLDLHYHTVSFSLSCIYTLGSRQGRMKRCRVCNDARSLFSSDSSFPTTPFAILYSTYKGQKTDTSSSSLSYYLLLFVRYLPPQLCITVSYLAFTPFVPQFVIHLPMVWVAEDSLCLYPFIESSTVSDCVYSGSKGNSSIHQLRYPEKTVPDHQQGASPEI